MKITDLKASIIQDSRGGSTIAVELQSGSCRVKASVPSGKSRGSFEAVPLSAENALLVIEKLRPRLIHREFKNIFDFEEELFQMDGTANKSRLGANVILALGVAFLRLLARENDLPLYALIARLSETEHPRFPYLFVNLINGGLHAEGKYLPLPFQEYLIIPEERSPKLALRTVFDFIEILKGAILARQEELVEGDEAGFVLSGDEPELGLEVLEEALRACGGREKMAISFGIDAAASSLWRDGVYCWRDKQWNAEDLMGKYEKMVDRYHLFSIEDPFDEESWDDWQKLAKKIGQKTLIVGDDLTVTNPQRIKRAKEKEVVNALIIKPNQIGSISETLQAIQLAKEFGWKIIVSHRSGETDDDFIADLAYGVAADGLKAGSPLQPERLVKYERLIGIEKNLV